MERPTLNDPKEFALIKKIHFAKDLVFEQVDEEERWDRMKRRKPTNQAR